MCLICKTHFVQNQRVCQVCNSWLRKKTWPRAASYVHCPVVGKKPFRKRFYDMADQAGLLREEFGNGTRELFLHLLYP